MRAEKEGWKASPSRGFAGMRTVEGDVCDCGADAAGNVDGAALRIVGGHGDAVACGSRSLSREQRPGRLPQLARGLTEYRNIYSDIPLMGGRHRSTSGGSKGAAPFGACKGGAGGNGGDRPCLPAPRSCMRPREQRAGVAKERVMRLIPKIGLPERESLAVLALVFWEAIASRRIRKPQTSLLPLGRYAREPPLHNAQLR